MLLPRAGGAAPSRPHSGASLAQGATAVAPDSPLWFLAELHRARALHNMQRQDEAFALLEKLATAKPERTDALVELAIESRAARLEEAVRAAEAAA